MFQLLFDNNIIYDPRAANPVDRLIVRSPSVKLVVGAAGAISFIIDSTHPRLNTLTRMHGVLELREDDSVRWRGRIVKDTKTLNLAHKIEAEGAMACLNDSLVAPYAFPDDFLTDANYQASENVVEFWLSWLLDQHNAQVGTEQQIKLGSVTVRDPNNYIIRSDEKYTSTWQVISEKLAGSALGGYLLMRYEPDGNYLDYLDDLPLTNVQEVEFSKNLLDLSSETYGGDIYTAILPLGKDGLTIEELPDEALSGSLVKAGKLIYDTSAESTYGGRITKAVTWDDVTLAANLKSKAIEMLGYSGVTMPETIRCQACDLHAVDGSVPSFREGRYVQVSSSVHGLSGLYPLLELCPNIMNPGNTLITLGETVRTLSSSVAAPNQTALSALVAVGEVRDSLEGTTESLIQTMVENVTAAIQTCEEIILQATGKYVETSNFEEFKRSVSAQLLILSEEISINLNTTTEQIVEINGDLQAQITDITNTYRFTSEGLIIGESGNTLTLRLSEDRISFLDSGLEVAYISERTLYITDAHFLNNLRIGNFAWVLRENGNLSLVKVGK